MIGVTTSRLKDGGFGFAVGAGDVERLLRVPLPINVALSDLPPENSPDASGGSSAPSDELKTAEDLFAKQQYTSALASLQQAPDATKTGFDGQLLLCRIQAKIPDYELAIRACDAAIALRPDSPAPYGMKALALIAYGDSESAEAPAAKAATLSDDPYYAKILGLTYYGEEKFPLVPKQIPADTNDSFELSLLAGAALHDNDINSFNQLTARLNQIKGDNNGWQLYRDARSAALNLDFKTARDKFSKCDQDDDFIDVVCILDLANVETRLGSYDSAKTHIDSAIQRYPKDHTVISEAIFIDLLSGNAADAKRLHDSLSKLSRVPTDDGTDCLYFYSINQPLLASEPCANSIQANEKNYTAWSNAGYVALDNGQYQSALTYFAKAKTIFDSSTEKHTVAEDLDLTWGLVLAGYFDGDRKDAKALYRDIKKEYPDFSTVLALKQLPLIWSDTTQELIGKVIADFK